MRSDLVEDWLREAVGRYGFPLITYDFLGGTGQIRHPDVRCLERTIRKQVSSKEPTDIKNGLTNVLYWGYARIGFRDFRVQRFRMKVTETQLLAAKEVFQDLTGPGLIQISKLGLPEFSMMPFVSKIRMFQDPSRYVTLDNKLAKLQERAEIFSDLSRSKTGDSIRITSHNELVYERWCVACQYGALWLADPRIIAADIERAIFQLVDEGRLDRATAIVDKLADAIN